jgi:hypothetical protein
MKLAAKPFLFNAWSNAVSVQFWLNGCAKISHQPVSCACDPSRNEVISKPKVGKSQRKASIDKVIVVPM